MASGGSQQQYLPSLVMDGGPFGSIGNFDSFSGGDFTAPVIEYRPGGMGPRVTYMALYEITNITLERVYEEARDHALVGQLHDYVGQIYGTISLQPLDDEGNPFGSPRTYYGRLQGVNDGNTDSNTAGVRKWTITFAIETAAN